MIALSWVIRALDKPTHALHATERARASFTACIAEQKQCLSSVSIESSRYVPVGSDSHPILSRLAMRPRDSLRQHLLDRRTLAAVGYASRVVSPPCRWSGGGVLRPCCQERPPRTSVADAVRRAENTSSLREKGSLTDSSSGAPPPLGKRKGRCMMCGCRGEQVDAKQLERAKSKSASRRGRLHMSCAAPRNASFRRPRKGDNTPNAQSPSCAAAALINLTSIDEDY